MISDQDQCNFYLYKLKWFLTELEAEELLEMLRWLDNYIMFLETEREQNITLKEKENEKSSKNQTGKNT